MLPDGWTERPLQDLAVKGIQNGVFNKPEDVGSGYKLINVSDLYNEPYIDYNALKLLDVDAKTFDKFQVNEGDLFYTRSSLKLGGIAHCNIFNEEKSDVIFECHIMRVRPNRNLVVPQFLHLYSHSHIARKQFIRNAKTTTMTTIDQGGLGSITIYLPPLEEQQEIVEIVYEWDKAADKLVKLIAKKQKQKKALMQRLLTGKHRFPEFEGQEWQEVELGDIFKEVKTKVGEKEVVPHSITAGTGFVSHAEKWGKDISGKQYENYTLLKKGQFAYNKGNSKKYACGCMYLLRHEDEIAVPNVFISFERDKDNVCNEFYEQYFTADYCARELKRYITSGARSDGLLNLSKANFFSVEVPLPPLAEQQKIAAVLNAADKETDLLTQKLEAYQDQKKGLMQQLLTGKKRVKIKEKEKAGA